MTTSLEETLAAISKQIGDLSAQLNDHREDTRRNMESMRSGFMNDINVLRRELDDRNQPRSKSKRLEEEYRSWVNNETHRGTSSRQE